MNRNVGALVLASFPLFAAPSFAGTLPAEAVWAEKCAICHDAPALAARLVVNGDGTLVGRYSGRNVLKFLAMHGRLAPTEVADMAAFLESFVQ